MLIYYKYYNLTIPRIRDGLRILRTMRISDSSWTHQLFGLKVPAPETAASWLDANHLSMDLPFFVVSGLKCAKLLASKTLNASDISCAVARRLKIML